MFVCDWWWNVDCSQAPNFYGLNANLYTGPAGGQGGYGGGQSDGGYGGGQGAAGGYGGEQGGAGGYDGGQGGAGGAGGYGGVSGFGGGFGGGDGGYSKRMGAVDNGGQSQDDGQSQSADGYAAKV